MTIMFPGRPSRIMTDGRIAHGHDGGGVPGALRELSTRVGRLMPDRRDPERFHEERSELADELRRLAQAMDA
jgi:hypothetical protein